MRLGVHLAAHLNVTCIAVPQLYRVFHKYHHHHQSIVSSRHSASSGKGWKSLQIWTVASNISDSRQRGHLGQSLCSELLEWCLNIQSRGAPPFVEFMFRPQLLWTSDVTFVHSHTHTAVILLTPWSRVLLEKLTVTQLVKKFSAFYGTRRFITVFTTALHWSVS